MKKTIEATIDKKLSGFKKIPDKCSVCDKTFDKTDRSQVFSWMLQVDEEREVYDLFCPPCYERHHPAAGTETEVLEDG